MKKRLLASVMSLCMILSLLPVSALAEEPAETPEADPTCICETMCTEDSWNEDCPVCKDGYELCAAPGDAEEEEPSAPSETPEAPLELEEETSEEPTEPAPFPPANNSLTAKPVMLAETEPAAENVIYVSASGNDDTGNGEKTTPYATLAKAVDAAQDGATIYVMSNLTVTKCIQVGNKNVTITSDGENPYTLMRGDNFITKSDGRSWYNPAMIEVTTTGVDSSVTLKNIILDDCGKYEGTIFTQASSAEGHGDNTQCVQDAIVAAYGLSEDSAQIILGEGTVLRNYGGMSAVRITAGASLEMEAGSVIEDTETVTDRTKGASGSNGPVGAVWVQGTGMVMDSGAEIRNIVGCAVLVEGGTAELNGKICNIKEDADMWQGIRGIALHLRGGSAATVGGEISDISSNAPNSNVIYGEQSSFTLEDGAIIQKCSGTGTGYGSLIYVTLNDDSYTFELYGTITECSAVDSLLYIVNTFTPVVIGADALIQDNTCNQLIYANAHNGSEVALDISGTIIENTCGASVFNGQNNGGQVVLRDGAKVNDNEITGEGGVFAFGANRVIIMEDGSEICNNTVADGALIVLPGEGNCFYMQGGTISGNTVTNGSLFAFSSGSWQQPSVFEIQDGTVTDNHVPHVLAVTTMKEKVPGVSSYLLVPEAYQDVYFEQDGKTVTVDAGTKLGNANNTQNKYAAPDQAVGSDPRSVANLKEAAVRYGWSAPFATFWEQNANSTPVTVRMDTQADGAAFDLDKQVYVLIQETDEKGAPATDAPVQSIAATVDSDGAIHFALPGNTNGYAVGLTQPNTEYGTLTINVPDSIQEVLDQTSYPVNYTVAFTPSENLKGMLGTEGDSIFTLTIDLDDAMTVQESGVTVSGAQGTVSVDSGNNVLTIQLPVSKDTGAVTVTIPAVAALAGTDFDAAGILVTTGELTGTVGSTNVNVPSNSAVTTLTAYVEPTPEPEPEPTPGGSTGGGGGGSHSDPTGNLTISLGGNGGNEDFTFTVIFTDKDGDELKNKFYYNGDDSGTVGSGGEIVLTDGDKIVIRNLPEGTRYEVILENADGYTVRSTGAEGVIRTSGNEAAFSVSPTVVLADPSVTGVTRWLNTTDHMAYLTGYPGGTFGPDNSMTRAEVAQMFYALLLNKDVTITKTFSDVPADAWYATAVNTLASLGMVSGDPDGTFRPNAPITRAEFCVIALAFAYEPDNAVCSFGDVSRGDWFYPYVAQAASYGWIGGYTNGNFGPNDQITRAQVTTIVNNMLGRAADRDYVIDHQADLVQFTDLTRAHWGFFQIMEATNAHDYTKSGGQETWR